MPLIKSLLQSYHAQYDEHECLHKSVFDSVVCICCPLQALEEEFTRKLQEQEVFFKMSGESECLNPTTQSRVSKFYPIPNLHNSGL